ncbi:MAG: MFS transporter [Lentilactobacillus diolivorans]|nr:MFS transporter [Lentilactobacillus diolivorans]RRG04053.1 MAG: MFS transporter [Lactobacillus sp.]
MVKRHLNNYLLPVMAMISSFASIEVYVGGMLIIKSASDSLVVNSSIASISSIGLIASTLFIGSKLDSVDKRRSLILFNALMFISLLIPFFSDNQLFLILYVCSDVFVSLFSLIESLSFSGIIKQLVEPQDLSKVINWNSSLGMVGVIASLGAVFIVVSLTKEFRCYLLIGGIAYFVNCILAILLVQKASSDNAELRFSTIDHLKKVAKSIWINPGLRESIAISIVFSLVETVFDDLLIYFWNKIDPHYDKIALLLVSYAVGISIGVVLIRFERYSWLMLSLVLFLTGTFLIMTIQISLLLMCLSIVAVMVSTIPLSNLASKARIKNTNVSVQSAQASFVEFGDSVLDVGFSTVLAGIAQALGNTTLILTFLGIFALVTMLICEKRIYAYDRQGTVRVTAAAKDDHLSIASGQQNKRGVQSN